MQKTVLYAAVLCAILAAACARTNAEVTYVEAPVSPVAAAAKLN